MWPRMKARKFVCGSYTSQTGSHVSGTGTLPHSWRIEMSEETDAMEWYAAPCFDAVFGLETRRPIRMRDIWLRSN